MLQESLRDPEMVFELLTDEFEAKKLINELAAQAAELQKPENAAKRLVLLEDLVKGNARLVYFYEDVIAQRIPVQGDISKLDNQVYKHRSESVRYANELVKMKGANLGQVIYLIGMNQILNGDTSGLAYMNKSRKALGAERVARVELLSAIKGNSKDNPAFRKGLNQLASGLGASGQVAAQLFIAQLDAKKKNPAYKNSLNKAVQASAKLARSDRERVIGFAVQMLSRTEGRELKWNKLAIDLKLHQDLDNTRAIRERAAIQASSPTNTTPALQFYRSIVEGSRGNARLALILDRILDLEEGMAQNKRSYLAYEKALVSSLEIVRDQSALGKGREAEAKASQTRIQQRYRRLVAQLISSSKQANASRDLRSQTIKIAQTFVKNGALPNEKIPVRSDIGRIYALNKQYPEAVGVFMSLHKETQGADAQQFLLAAMESQRILAKWPVTAPWGQMSKEQVEARRYLAEMYDIRFKATNSWDDLAHVGLLAINLGNGGKAFQVWTKQLEKNTQGPHARFASGMMLASYRTNKEWQKLEDLSRLAIKTKLSPQFGNRTLDPVALLGDALFEGGKEHYAEKRYAPSSEKLDEFVKRYQKDSRRPEGMFVLGKAFHMVPKHPRSVETLFALVNEYPGSIYEHDALLFGGQWTVPMAWEDQTIFFYQRFVDRFAKDAKTPGIRMNLAQLYMGREHYGNAVRLYAAQVEDSKVSKAEKIKMALLIMHVEERYGDAKHAVWGANKARELSGNDPAVVGDILSFEARRAAASGDMGKVQSIEAQLTALNLNDRNVVESQAQLRYLIAEKVATSTKQEIFNLAQTDPVRTLSVVYGNFLKTRDAYDKVCAAGTSTYCGLAMLRLSEVSRNSLSSIEDLSIAQTLDEKVVRSFENQKLGVINVIAKTTAKADAMAVSISEAGESTPEWSQEIVVTNSEGGLERSHGAVGNGYVQWLPVKTDD